MNPEDFPDVDNLDVEVDFESSYRALRQALVKLLEKRDMFYINEVVQIAKELGARSSGLASQSNVILATLKAMLRDKLIKKVDNEQFYHYDRVPKFRSIDDKFAAYVTRPEEDRPKLPTKKDILADVARVARMFERMQFTMSELASAWSKNANPGYVNALKAVFGISPEIKSSGKRIFLDIMQALVDQNVIEADGGDNYRNIIKPPKKERFRSLDDDWH